MKMGHTSRLRVKVRLVMRRKRRRDGRRRDPKKMRDYPPVDPVEWMECPVECPLMWISLLE
jgi:hypothetical protein